MIFVPAAFQLYDADGRLSDAILQAIEEGTQVLSVSGSEDNAPYTFISSEPPEKSNQ